ncbi:hypothetical protein V6238_12015 [Marinomonas arenicola]|uniref:hypothetical protein n=1 Tax=Marinomonas arenicola TaxID=569601 RepID=UPI00311D8E22
MTDQTLSIVAGTTFDFELIWETQNVNGGLEAVDITGCQVDLQIRNAVNDSLLISCSMETKEVTVIDPQSGTMQFHIAPSKTVNQDVAAWKDARWEVRVTFPSDDVYSLVRGWAKLIIGVVK